MPGPKADPPKAKAKARGRPKKEKVVVPPEPSDLLKPGGILVYVTCSIFPTENE